MIDTVRCYVKRQEPARQHPGTIGLIVGVSCLLCSSALPGVWSFLRVTHGESNRGQASPTSTTTISQTKHQQPNHAATKQQTNKA